MHLKQFGDGPLYNVAKLLIGQNEPSRGVRLSDAHTGLTEHAAQTVFAMTQSSLKAISERDFSAECEAQNGHTKHEHGQQREAVDGYRFLEEAIAGEGSPNGKACENKGDGCGISWAASEGRP